MTNFTNLVEASNTINEIAENAKVMHEEFMTSNYEGVVEQVIKYMTEFCKPLHDLDIEFDTMYAGLRFSKKKKYCELHKQCLTNDGIKTFDATFTRYITATDKVIEPEIVVKIAQYWNGFKNHLIKVVEAEIETINNKKQYEVDKMMRDQEVIKNFTI